jgi:hypothetical protein
VLATIIAMTDGLNSGLTLSLVGYAIALLSLHGLLQPAVAD